jgi:secondary thiamine-phosphate synthase enzyme
MSRVSLSELIHERLVIDTSVDGSSLHEVTNQIQRVVNESGIYTGMCIVFVRHTSCSLVIQENADPSARYDLEQWMQRLAPEDDPRYTHTLEGADDMPAHLRAAVTRTSEQIPIIGGRLGLGTWQGLYLWEHRRQGSRRELIVSILGCQHDELS